MAEFQQDEPSPDDLEVEGGDEDPLGPVVERGCPLGPTRFEGLPTPFDDRAAPLIDQFGAAFVMNMTESLRRWETAEDVAYKISFLELALHVVMVGKVWLLVPHASIPPTELL